MLPHFEISTHVSSARSPCTDSIFFRPGLSANLALNMTGFTAGLQPFIAVLACG